MIPSRSNRDFRLKYKHDCILLEARHCFRFVWTVLAVSGMVVTNWTVSSFPTVPAFVATRLGKQSHHHELFMSSSSWSSSSSSPMNAFGPFGDFLNDGRGRRNHTVAFMATAMLMDDDANNNMDDPVAGTFRLITLDVTAIKPGGLRLFLMLHLMGIQNYDYGEEPKQNMWKIDQPSSDEYVIDVWFHDRSAVLSISLDNAKLTIDRVGSEPSTRYLMQESIVLQGLLEELEKCANDESVAVENRLLVLQDSHAIENYRGALSFA